MEQMPEYKKGECAFCYDLALQKYLRKQSRKEMPPGFYDVYKVSLICMTYRKGYGRRSTLECRCRPLNFCPECGRPMKKRKAPAE